jgi:transcriptional antiterminator RfaH
MIDFMNKWLLIYTKPQQEKVALDNLTRQNYQCYLPLINKEKISHGKKILSKEPMFPRYLFVRLRYDVQQNWSPIRSTLGVSHLVSFGGLAASLDDDTIGNLKQKVDEALVVKVFSIGDKVEILKGPFKGMEAIFNSYKGQERAMLFLNFMAKNLTTKFDLRDFKKAT